MSLIIITLINAVIAVIMASSGIYGGLYLWVHWSEINESGALKFPIIAMSVGVIVMLFAFSISLIFQTIKNYRHNY